MEDISVLTFTLKVSLWLLEVKYLLISMTLKGKRFHLGRDLITLLINV